MNLVSNSQASTYCSEADSINQTPNAPTPLRRSQRLRSMTPTSHCAGCNTSKSVSPLSLESRRRRYVRSPPLFPSFVENSMQKENINKPNMVAMETALSTMALTTNKQVRKRTRKPVKRVPAKRKSLIVRSKGKPRGRPSSKCNRKRMPESQAALKPGIDVDTKFMNPNFTASFSEEVMNAKRERPIERYYVRPSALGPTPGNLSILPAQYPSHFIHQLPPESQNNLANYHVADELKAEFQRVFHENELDDYYRSRQEAEQNSIMEDWDSISLAHVSDTSTDSSLSDSMQEIFGTKCLRTALDLQPYKYRITEDQLTAVAMILNIELSRLRGVINIVLKLPPDEILSMAAELVGISSMTKYGVEANDENSEQQSQYRRLILGQCKMEE